MHGEIAVLHVERDLIVRIRHTAGIPDTDNIHSRSASGKDGVLAAMQRIGDEF